MYLVELGFDSKEPILLNVSEEIFSRIQKDGRIRTSPIGTIYPCHTIIALNTLCWLGYAHDTRLAPVIDYLLQHRYQDGGGYVNQPNQFHLSFLEEISDRSRAIIYMPVYPKVPHFCALDAYEQLNVFYNHLLKEHPLCQMVWMGDSAGAGLALGLSMTFRDQSDPQPDTLILMSPWLDIRLSNPLSEQMERKDPMLGVYGLRKVGHMWGRGLDARDSRISPFYDEGNLSQLVYIIMGTNELFLPDAREFREKLRLQKVNLVYEEYRGMPHVFPLVNYPESKKARNRIIEILTLDK